jgi:hypothetical protein
MIENNTIAVVISTHNNINYLKLLYSSIINNFTIVDDIIIYAENCTDGTNEWLSNIFVTKDKPSLYVYIQNDVINPGISSGINKAISMVDTDYFILLHSDMYVTKGYDIELYNYFTKEEYRDKRLIVSGWRAEPNIWGNNSNTPGLVTAPISYFGEYYHNFRQELFNEWAIIFSKQNRDKTIRNMMGAGGYMMKKSDWDYLGGNDEIFNPACYEDIDLCLRAQLKDFELITTCNTLIYHFSGRGSWYPTDNIGKKSERQQTAEQTGMIKWLNKWGERFERDESDCPILTKTMKNFILKNRNNFVY